MTDGLVEVRLIGLPVPIHVQASSHMDGLQREFELVRRRDTDASSVPNRLQLLIDDLQREFGGVGEQPVEELDAAAERGDETVDLVYRVPPEAAEGSRRLGAMLDEVDDYCRTHGHLLTLVTPTDALEYRRWFLGQFVDQIAGAAPVPWSEHRPSPGAPDVDAPPPMPAAFPAPTPAGWTVDREGTATTVHVRGPLDLVSAPSLRDVLVEHLTDGGSLTVDLSGCDFVDSVGVSVLVAAMARAEEQGVTLRFRLSDAAERILRITGLAERVVLADG